MILFSIELVRKAGIHNSKISPCKKCSFFQITQAISKIAALCATGFENFYCSDLVYWGKEFYASLAFLFYRF